MKSTHLEASRLGVGRVRATVVGRQLVDERQVCAQVTRRDLAVAVKVVQLEGFYLS